MTDTASAQSDPQTAAEYEATFEGLIAEMESIHERMSRDRVGSDRAEIERLKAETRILRDETRALLASMGAEV